MAGALVVVVAAAVAVGLQLVSSSVADNKPVTAYNPDLEPLKGAVPEPKAQLVSFASAPPATPASVPVDGPRRYVVQPGDSVESIAARIGLRPDTLASVNDLENPTYSSTGVSWWCRSPTVSYISSNLGRLCDSSPTGTTWMSRLLSARMICWFPTA